MNEDELKELELAVEKKTSLPFVAFNEITAKLPKLIQTLRRYRAALEWIVTGGNDDIASYSIAKDALEGKE